MAGSIFFLLSVMFASSLSEGLASAEMQAFMTGFPTLALHAGVTVALLVLGAWIYAVLTPWREVALIRSGNAAAAAAFGGVLLGLAIPLAVSLSVSTSSTEIVVWGLATLLIQLLAFRLVDALLHGLPERIEKGEMAAAVTLVAAKLATALVLAAALTG